MSFDDFAVAGMVFFGAILLAVMVAVIVGRIDRRNPYRNMEARKKMATDWRKPSCLPEDWH
jgi:hypothetical protein